jgi:DNA-binding CsgD family transcriptional regulator
VVRFGSAVADSPTDEAVREIVSLLEHVPVPSWIVDRNGVFVWANDAHVAVFGDRRGEHYSRTVAPECLPTVEKQFQRKLQGHHATDYEIDALLPDGSRVRTEISAVRLGPNHLCGAVFGTALVHRSPAGPAGSTRLTPRQLEVLQLLAGGASTDRIAAELYLTPHTVRNHVRQILKALSAHSRLEAVVKARREGLVED